MDIGMISSESKKILEQLFTTNLKPDEKIAALDTAAATIRSVMAAESLRVMYANLFEKMGK